MSKISYFQRYSQRENHTTNNTLLIMRHFYQASPQKISTVLSNLANDIELPVGLVFQQQVRLTAGIPDALISQTPLDIYIETKRVGQLDQEQIERYIDSIRNDSKIKTVLFGLTRMAIEREIRDKLGRKASKKNIVFVPITFADIVRELNSVCESHESALKEILLDYEDYLKDEDLLPVGDLMSVFPCGTSIEENVKHQLYFEPPSRRTKKASKFIGLYHRKSIRHLASIKTVVVGVRDKDGFSVTDTEKGTLSDKERDRIKGAMSDCIYYNLAQGKHRYYLFGDMCQTNFIKSSKYALRNRRDLNLAQWLDYEKKKEYSAKEVADCLRGKEF